jgi:outer membrane protein with beta-barrel domain
MRLHRNRNRFAALVVGSLASLLLCVAVKAQASTEIIPSVGLTRSADTDETKSEVGLALRGGVIQSLLDLELKGQYRKQDELDGLLTEKMWPVTASLYLTPLRVLYAGGGVGWYHTTLDYKAPSTLPDETHQKFGVHASAGVRVPLAGDAVGLDLNGRYTWLENQETASIPSKFNPDFWDMSLGLAFRFSGSGHNERGGD